MFARRMFGTGAIPRTMYHTLHISSARQAARLVPCLVPLSAAVERSSPMQQMVASGCEPVSSPLSEMTGMDSLLLRALLESISPMQISFIKLLELWGIGRSWRVMSAAEGVRLG